VVDLKYNCGHVTVVGFYPGLGRGQQTLSQVYQATDLLQSLVTLYDIICGKLMSAQKLTRAGW